MTAPQRSLGLATASNLRDLGGYLGAGGRPVRWRVLFRSDHFGQLSAADAQAVDALGLKRALDLRGAAERASASYALRGVAYHALTIEPTVVQALEAILASGRQPQAAEAVRLMEQTYEGFVTQHTARFAELFAHLLAGDGPLVFHCTAGKDRTGFAAALLLQALGVGHADVMQDYLLTNALYQPTHAGRAGLDAAVAQVLWGVQPSFLQAAFAAVEAGHGSVDRYLTMALGIGPAQRARLMALYLED